MGLFNRVVAGSVFPTGVGMNRVLGGTRQCRSRVPHRRGDEPDIRQISPMIEKVFPTGVGMNRRLKHTSMDTKCVPHRRGDEPMLY